MLASQGPQARHDLFAIPFVPGWNALYEELCAPIDEVDQFNRRIRNPAGGVTEP
jgi:hypothetical protein